MNAAGRSGSCFVTGTDTGVGKTLIASALLRALGARGLRVAGMKPVAAGAVRIDGRLHNEDVEALRAAGNVDVPLALQCPFLFEAAVAPHIAARLEGRVIEPARIREAFDALCARADALVVEGVGGFRVPLDGATDTADLARLLQLPVVLVVGLRLGCLNHAALTAEAIATRGLRLAGWVANAIDPAMSRIEENLATLEQILSAPCLARVPWMERPDSRTVAHLLGLEALRVT